MARKSAETGNFQRAGQRFLTSEEPASEILGEAYNQTPLADLGPDRDRFHDADYTPQPREMVDRVIKQEAPIQDNLLIERLTRAHCIARSGRVVRKRILSVAHRLAHFRTEEGGSVFA